MASDGVDGSNSPPRRVLVHDEISLKQPVTNIAQQQTLRDWTTAERHRAKNDASNSRLIDTAHTGTAKKFAVGVVSG